MTLSLPLLLSYVCLYVSVCAGQGPNQGAGHLEKLPSRNMSFCFCSVMFGGEKEEEEENESKTIETVKCGV